MTSTMTVSPDRITGMGRPPGIATMLTNLRAAFGLTVDQAALAAETEPEIWANWERGEVVPASRHLEILMDAWRLSPNDRTKLRLALERAGVSRPRAADGTQPRPVAPAATATPIRIDPTEDRHRSLMGGSKASLLPDPPAPKPEPKADPLAGFELVPLEVVAPETVVVSLEPNSGDIRLRKGARELVGTDVRRVDVLVHHDGKALAVVPHVGEGEGRCLASRGDISVTPIRSRLAKSGWPKKAAYRAERIPGKPGFIVRLSGKEG